jgi:stage II sporulation protein D
MYRLKLITLLAFSIFFRDIIAQNVSISLFNNLSLQTIVISVPAQSYIVTLDNTTSLEPANSDIYYLTRVNDKITVRNKQEELGSFSEIKITSKNKNNTLTINPVVPRATSRQYPGSLHINIAFNRISIINEVEPNDYIAAVVEAESGTNATVEFYKAQSVLARTYLYGHADKHSSEGFNLCDGEHCQAYKGMATKNPLIKEATKATTGFVALINDSTYITAAFHANCGGFTESAENAWLSKKEYLLPIKDPFCQNSPAARWEKTITTEQWRKYLKDHGFKSASRIPYIDFSIVNTEREQYYILKNDSIPYKQIRSDFQLKSSFFSISANEKEIIFKGRGYGHGVGLCQEGAIQMSKIGYKFEEILKYYFKGIEVVRK